MGTFIIRSLWSLIICVIAVTGLGIASTNNIKHNYFEFMYFTVVFLIELTMSIIYLWLFCKQRGLIDLEPVNKKDCVWTCVSIFLRIGWHIALSLFIIIRINMESFIKDDYKWKEIRDLTIIVMVFTLFHIIGFIVGLVY